ncbi:MAG TPA: enoyl-CoA hydratase/isomerase family protein [Candidatus Binatus sp.]|nr:enoyl-CoA hydratase/isomerase family protein [Candidatus Binatus sp.]
MRTSGKIFRTEDESNVRYRVSGRTAHVTMNRPRVMNALSKAMFRELRQAIQAAASDQRVAFISINGAGKAFSAGLDIVQVAGFNGKNEARNFVYRLVKPFWDTFLSCDKIIISMVNGPAYGAGAEIALFSDIVIASPEATFAFSGGRVGALCCMAGILGPLTMNGRKVAEMNLTGHPVTAEEALRLGMINSVVPSDQLDRAFTVLEEELTSVSPVSNSSYKRIQRSVIPKKSYETAYHELYKTLTGPNFKIGAEAFTNKAAPRFYEI